MVLASNSAICPTQLPSRLISQLARCFHLDRLVILRHHAFQTVPLLKDAWVFPAAHGIKANSFSAFHGFLFSISICSIILEILHFRKFNRQWAPWLVKGQRAPAGGLLCQLAGVAGHRVVLFSWRPLCLGSVACRALCNESILFVRNCLLGLGSGDRLITCHSKGVLECLVDGSEGLSGPQNCLQR